jgi:hypothetical protein
MATSSAVYSIEHTQLGQMVEDFAGHQRGFARGPERALMSALLFDGVQAYMGYLLNTKRKGTGRLHEAYRWVTDSSSDYVFSFNNVCESLGIDPDFLRYGLANAAQTQQQEMSKARRH